MTAIERKPERFYSERRRKETPKRRREFSPIICGHCRKELIPTSSRQQYHSECHKKIRAEWQKTMYHKDPEYRNRVIRINEESRIRRLRGETRPRDPKATKRWRVTMLANQRGETRPINPEAVRRWRITRLEHEIEETGRILRKKVGKPLFPVKEGSSVIVYLEPPNPKEPQWHLALRTLIKKSPSAAELPFDAQTAIDLYDDKPRQELKKVKAAALRK